jgi:tetratricopeptide (TPR) repeat protein
VSEIEKSAQDLLAVALSAIQRRALDEAKTIAEAAAVFAHSASLPGLEAHAHKIVARVHHEREDFEASRRSFLAAAQADRERGHELAALRTEVALAFTYYDEGDGPRASAMLDAIEAQVQKVEGGSSIVPAILGYRGNIARQAGQFTEARALYAEAIQRSFEMGDALFAWVFVMDAAITTLLEGDAAQALTEFARAYDATTSLKGNSIGRDMLRWMLSHYLMLVKLVLGVPVDGVEEGPNSPSLRGMREALFENARRGVELAKLNEFSAKTEHARITKRVLERLTSERAPRVIVQRDGSHLVHRDRVVDLSKRPSLRGILAALAKGHSEAHALLGEALIRAGWPDEKLVPRAAKNRLHVALTTLRQLGLEDVLCSGEGGYWLERERTIVVG